MKVWLCGITNEGNKKNLEELILPIIKYFDGLVWTFHYPKDEGANFLEEHKKAGKVIYAEWCQRHGYSMNHYLWQGPMKEGDYFVQLDTQERVSKEFCEKELPNFIKQMEDQKIGMIANFGKGLIFRYSEGMEFRGSPHWFPANIFPNAMGNIELDKTFFWNVRNQQRDDHQWVDHYAKYMLYPAGSNHALLGLEHNGAPEKLFPPREYLRLAFRQELIDRGFPLTIEGVKECFQKSQMIL
jgi:hypothetical protein